ncbi:DHS-like NAD/FAD-binding domain containing protein [Amanita muscaria]
MAPSADKETFRELLASSRNIIIISGAGLSAPSGIPTYRGSSNSLWVQNSISFGTPEQFRINASASWRFHHLRRLICLNAKPNNAHRVLAVLNNPPTLSRIAPLAQQPLLHITQNIDELSLRVLDALPQDVQDIANEHTIQIHGSILRTRCTSCQHILHSYDPFLAPALKDVQADDELQDIPVDKLPKCGGDSWAGSNRYGRCGGLLRPDVIWFGEVPPQLGEVARKITWCDLLIVVGTSALVKPASEFPSQVKHHGGKVAIFNMNRSEGDEEADFLFLGGCEETLADVLGVGEDIADFWTS